MRVLSVLTTALIVVVVVVGRGDRGVHVITCVAIGVRVCVYNKVRGMVVHVNARANSIVGVVAVVSNNFVVVVAAAASTISTSISMLVIIDVDVAINGIVSDDFIAALE